MIRCHDQAHLSATQFVRDALVQKLNTQCVVEVFLLKVTNLSVDLPKASGIIVEFQVGKETLRAKLAMKNGIHAWDVDHGFRSIVNRNMANELKARMWARNPGSSESGDRYDGTSPLAEFIGGISISFPNVSPKVTDLVVAYPFDVPVSFGNQKHQSMMHLKLCYSDQLRQDPPLSPTGAQPDCFICGAPVPPGRLYCASCAHVFNQQTLTETLPRWFIPRQRICISPVEKLTDQGLETNVLAGALKHSSIDVVRIYH